MKSNRFREALNKGKLVGQKALLKPKDIWAIRIHLQNAHEVRDVEPLKRSTLPLVRARYGRHSLITKPQWRA